MFENLTIFKMARERMGWVADRQKVLAENIANANTPKYQAQDLKPLDFKSQLQPPQVAAAVTHPAHVATPPLVNAAYGVQKDRRPFESSPDGNSVVMEEQIVKLSEAKGAYELAANLFQKHARMIKSAIGKQ